MPSVKIPKHVTENDMTPFVDIGFLILTFFIMATKFKPPEAVEITPPSSVSSKELEQKDGVLVTMDKDGRVFFTMQVEKDPAPIQAVMQNMNTSRGLGLTDAEIAAFIKEPIIGVPIAQLKQFMGLSEEQKKNFRMPGIPVEDSANNELYLWVRDAVSAFSGKQINYMIKGDNNAKYPNFKNVLEAFKRNEIFKFQLVTAPEDVPEGTDLFRVRRQQQQGG
jgi:biopolymer transport protein ExbD